MRKRFTQLPGLAACLWLIGLPAAHAQFAVIDVGTITQLIQQVATAAQQLQTAESQLVQAQVEYKAITGDRGMGGLLPNQPRNYLPNSWNEVQAAMNGTGATSGGLSGSVQGYVASNSVLTAQQVSALSAGEQAQLNAARRSVALQQGLVSQALATTSQRFAALQQLISAIPGATDQKAALDLHARIAAEQAMLQNESTKLEILQRGAQAQELARRQQLREQGASDIGSFRKLPPMGL